MSYQSVVRNASNQILANQSIGVKISIVEGSITGTVVYSEAHTTTTNASGLFTLEAGGGTPTTGTFSAINWGNGSHYIKSEIDVTGGTNYALSGTMELLSVPYALYAANAGNTQTHFRTTIYLSGDITNAQAAAKIASELGPETDNIYIRNTTQLTTVDLSAMTHAAAIEVVDNAALTNLNFSGLTTVYNSLNVDQNPLLNTVLLQSLTDCSQVNVNNASSVNLSSILKCTNLYVNNVTTLNLSSLTKCYNELTVNNITNFTPPTNLVKCRNLVMYNIANITALTFPIADVYMAQIYGNPLLSSISFPALSTIGTELYLALNALSTATINSLLHQISIVLAAEYAGGFKHIVLNMQTPMTAPSGQGIIDKQTLVDAGHQIETD
ncbi:MAG: hypothetical protein CFE24_14325 [Flavobacterium sp. BFFFF2]|nr:MAG: hypothetical protein CFE24_14325 [Flavobacterium sp. BFFFF2]